MWAGWLQYATVCGTRSVDDSFKKQSDSLLSFFFKQTDFFGLGRGGFNNSGATWVGHDTNNCNLKALFSFPQLECNYGCLNMVQSKHTRDKDVFHTCYPFVTLVQIVNFWGGVVLSHPNERVQFLLTWQPWRRWHTRRILQLFLLFRKAMFNKSSHFYSFIFLGWCFWRICDSRQSRCSPLQTANEWRMFKTTSC